MGQPTRAPHLPIQLTATTIVDTNTPNNNDMHTVRKLNVIVIYIYMTDYLLMETLKNMCNNWGTVRLSFFMYEHIPNIV